MEIAGYLESQGTEREVRSNPVNLRRFLRENDLMFDGVILTDDDKEWVERMLTTLFWKERHKKEEA
jgi:hypothetical protein